MPRYEFRCRSCGDTFEVNRPMTRAGEPATCPHGHTDTVKLLSTVALTGRGATGSFPAGRGAAGDVPGGAPGGGCCGGGCGC